MGQTRRGGQNPFEKSLRKILSPPLYRWRLSFPERFRHAKNDVLDRILFTFVQNGAMNGKSDESGSKKKEKITDRR